MFTTRRVARQFAIKRKRKGASPPVPACKPTGRLRRSTLRVDSVRTIHDSESRATIEAEGREPSGAVDKPGGLRHAAGAGAASRSPISDLTPPDRLRAKFSARHRKSRNSNAGNDLLQLYPPLAKPFLWAMAPLTLDGVLPDLLCSRSTVDSTALSRCFANPDRPISAAGNHDRAGLPIP